MCKRIHAIFVTSQPNAAKINIAKLIKGEQTTKASAT